MRIRSAWMRATATAAIAVGMGGAAATAQYAPFKPIPPEPVVPQATVPLAQAPQYMAYRQQPAYQQPVNPVNQQPVNQQPAYQAYQQPAYQQPAYQPPATARYQAPVAAHAQAYPQQAQVPAYQPTSVAPYQPAVAVPYTQAPVPYPQTAARYPAAYGSSPLLANQQPTEVLPPPQAQPNAGQPGAVMPPMEATPATPMPGPMDSGVPASATPMTNGYSAAGCNCGGEGYNAGYGANGYYGATGCASGYPDLSGYCDSGCSSTQWFGGIYYLYMDRVNPDRRVLTYEVDHSTAPDPYFPFQSEAVICTDCVGYDYRSGVEIRLGSTFLVGGGCDPCASNYATGCNGCAPCCTPATMYAWEFAWWGIDHEPSEEVFPDPPTLLVYGMVNFAGLDYDRDGGGGTYTPRPVNDVFGYEMPIVAPPGSPSAGDTLVLAQRAWSDFKAQNLELNLMRFPVCNVCTTGCSDCYTGCGCEETNCSNFSMYGSCGLRYFRTDDNFAFDTEFGEYDGSDYDQDTPDGFSYDNSNELCYDIDVENNLVGTQLGWTMNYAVGSRWNFFCNTAFGVYNNHMSQYQRMWSGGGGTIVFSNSGNDFNVRSNKDDIAFLGELRFGGSYDISYHWRAVAAYRALALSGIATTLGQIPDNYSSEAEIAHINSDESMLIHGLQLGAECRY
ncbi:MAG: BBP7 family outer membrane beta-barrel protein [Pirellulales bacterium]|nr:BBP7 family outer membrane beta-barrel protein [Pirellulales bacterium]